MKKITVFLSQQSSQNPLGEIAWFGEVLLALLTIFLLIFIGIKLWRRRSNPMMRVIAKLPLEAKRSVYLIEAAETFLLIGAGEGGLSTLAELEAEQVNTMLHKLKASPPPTVFSWVQKYISSKKTEDK